MSRIGNQTIPLPDKVTVSVADGGVISVEGPKGKLEWTLPEGIALKQEDGIVSITRANESKPCCKYG
jgi:large subunit ribosomal protein L6